MWSISPAMEGARRPWSQALSISLIGAGSALLSDSRHTWPVCLPRTSYCTSRTSTHWGSDCSWHRETHRGDVAVSELQKGRYCSRTHTYAADRTWTGVKWVQAKICFPCNMFAKFKYVSPFKPLESISRALTVGCSDILKCHSYVW